MKTNLSKYQADLDRLMELCDRMHKDLIPVASEEDARKGEKKSGQLFFSSYQRWYSEAHEVIRQILPSRLTEFEALYQGNPKRKTLDVQTYTIRDWLLGIRATADALHGRKYFDDAGIVFMQFQMQREILQSARLRFESSLLDITHILRADLFDSEVESARELLKNGFLRAAGAVAGVVIEKHLGQICQSHNVSIKKKDPTITIYNDALKNQGAIEVPEWRFIQRLGDLRNLCDHNRDREPNRDDVTELIDGVEKLIKTVL